MDYDTKYDLLIPEDPSTTPPLPHNAASDIHQNKAWISDTWNLTISACQLYFPDLQPPDLPASPYVAGVKRTTKVQEITNDLQKWLLHDAKSVSQDRPLLERSIVLVDAADTSRPITVLDPDATVESADLFNKMYNIIVCNRDNVTNTPGDANLCRIRQMASQGAGNSRVAHAPGHIDMVNGLLKSNGKRAADTNLSQLTKADYKKLKSHMKTINTYPQCVCFNVSPSNPYLKLVLKQELQRCPNLVRLSSNIISNPYQIHSVRYDHVPSGSQ